MTDLKPCPFCGGEAEIFRPKLATGYFVGCKGPCSGGHAQGAGPAHDTEKAAIAAWNRRAPVSDAATLIKAALGAAAEECARNALSWEGIAKSIPNNPEPAARGRTARALEQAVRAIAVEAVIAKVREEMSDD